MIGNHFARLTGSKRNLLVLLASSAVLTAGCSNMSSTAPSVNPFSSPAALSGKIHGGNQPVIGAAVTLWFAGQGVPATKAAITTTDSSGSFSFTKGSGGNGTTNVYTCPTSGGSPLVYVTSVGGNTQNNGVAGQTNTAAAFIALYGECVGLTSSNFVYMSEVTTVATMAAVQQLFNPAADANGNIDTLRADSIGEERLITLNIPNTVALLANVTTGLAVSSTTIPAASNGNIASSVTLTATPESAKINTLANIISTCINGATATEPACGTLFSNAVPPPPNVTNLNPGSFPAATDTLQALFYIFTNPSNTAGTMHLQNLFALAPAIGAPYQPALAAQPTDWTVGVSYASTSTCGTPTGGSGSFIFAPTDINIDGQNNVWFNNGQTGGNLSSISATGAPFHCVNFDAGLTSSGGTLDSSGNVWSAGGTTMYRYNPATHASLPFPVAVAPLAITADGVGNVYFTAVSGPTGSLYELPLGATVSAAVAPVQISSTVGAGPLRLMPDYKGNATQGNIWVSSGSTFISQVAPSTAVGSMNGFLTTAFPTSGNSYGLSVGRGGIFTSALDTGDITQLVNNGTTYPDASGFPFPAASAGINAPKGLSVDGRANTWIPNSGARSFSEVTDFGTNEASPLTPSTGFQKDATYLNASQALAVDWNGNVWIAGGGGNTFVTEIIGAAVPLYQPYAVGLANGRFQTVP
jgi:hypothetical protein